MGNNFQALLVIIVYAVLLFGFSFIADRMVKKRAGTGTEAFLMAGRSFGTVLVLFMIVGAAIGANGTIGVAQLGYETGISAGWYSGAFGIAIVLTAFVFLPKLKKLNVTTISEVYGNYYNHNTRIMASVGQFIVNWSIMIAQYIAGGAILSSLLPQFFNMTTGMIFSAVLFIGISMIGGYMASGVTNVLNIIMVYIGVTVGAVFTILQVGGFKQFAMDMPNPEIMFSPHKGLGLSVVISYLILFICQIPTLQVTTQMIFSAKSEKAAKRGYIIGGILVFPIGFICALIGMAALIKLPNLADTATALPMVVMSFPPIVAGLVLAGMLAADVSTGTALIIGASTLFLNDFYPLIAKGPKDEKKELLISKAVSLIFALVALYFAFNVSSILRFVTSILSVTVGFLIILIISMYTPKICRDRTALVTFIVNLVTLVVWQAKLVPGLHDIFSHVTYVQLITNSLAVVAVYFLDKKPAKCALDAALEKSPALA